MMLSANSPASPESSSRIRAISSCSSDWSTRISLLASTTLMGSMNTVAPDAEVSWTRPGISPRYSAFTGTTYRPPRWVTMASCRCFWWEVERMSLSSCSRARTEAARIFRRMAASAGEAASATSSSLTMQVKIFSSKYLLGARISNRAVRAFFTPALFSCHCFRERMARRVAPTASSSGRPSPPPAWARRRALVTFCSP